MCVFTCKESLAAPSTARRSEDLDMNSSRPSFLLRQYKHTAVIENARTRIGRNGSDSKVILVFSPAALRYPKHDRGEHQPYVLRNVAVPVVLVHLRVVVHDVLEDQDALEKCVQHALEARIGHEVGKKQEIGFKEITYDASSETSSHQREADEQKQSGPPNRPGIPEPVLTPHTVLVDQVDDEHPEQRTDSRDPVDERDVHQHRFRLVLGLGVRGEDGGVEECPIGDGELQHAARRICFSRDTRSTHAVPRGPKDDSRVQHQFQKDHP